MKYRRLKVGEIIQEGDEIFIPSRVDPDWLKIENNTIVVGHPVTEEVDVRRPLPQSIQFIKDN